MTQTGVQMMTDSGHGPDIRAHAAGWVLDIGDPALGLMYNPDPASPEPPARPAVAPPDIAAEPPVTAAGSPVFQWPALAAAVPPPATVEPGVEPVMATPVPPDPNAAPDPSLPPLADAAEPQGLPDAAQASQAPHPEQAPPEPAGQMQPPGTAQAPPGMLLVPEAALPPAVDIAEPQAAPDAAQASQPTEPEASTPEPAPPEPAAAVAPAMAAVAMPLTPVEAPPPPDILAPAPPSPVQTGPAPAPAAPLPDILPPADAMRVFAMELAIQAHDAPALPMLPGGFSAADLAAYYAMVRRYRPGLVVEFGGGNGTPMASAALTANGRGRVLRFAADAIGLPRVEHAGGGIAALTAEWAAATLSAGDMVVLDPALPAAEVLHILGTLLPASKASLHVHLHGLPVVTGGAGAGMDAAAAQTVASDRRVSVLFATAWHAAHNPMALDALVRGRSGGQGGSLWLQYHPAR